MICSSPIIEFVIKLLHDIIKNVELNNPYTNNKRNFTTSLLSFAEFAYAHLLGCS
ncbi:hypothetical protein BACOVA_00441 [Bacteroides ovatus ATCC 8483]|uniref:Uncharacterized protein n=1 Tax=Bacteroides ovatus (strain ATCC 8483 / DSM 1896 / JCM 5824 / BCRC 10623 / CCUG 4943 / NCTC 11153) TaxID=411476 RepID=A0AAN3ACC7_BACO1|nr:hypothetical protein BACOVA_00441 [Bacteroides ovatus ATCC 8483]